MTTLLKQAFLEASKLPEIEQNSLAKWLLEELVSDKKWNKTFAESEKLLDLLADKAIEADLHGETEILDIDKL